MKTWQKVVLGVVAIGIIGAFMGEDAQPAKEQATVIEEKQSAVVEEMPVVETIKDATIGDTVDNGKYKITLNSMDGVQNTYIFDILIENLTNEDVISSTMLSYSVSGDDGYQGEVDFFADVKGSLDGSVPAQGKLRGQIAFTMQEGSNPETLSINLDVFSNNPIKFKLN